MHYLFLIIDYVLTNSVAQKVYKLFYLFGLWGMNYNFGDSYQQSGEVTSLKYLLSKLPANKKLVLFDVGANIGSYTRLMLQVAGNKNTIYSFEPSKFSFAKLKKNISGENIHFFNLGFGDKKEKTKLYFDQRASALASVTKRRLDHFHISTEFTESINLDTLDSFCSKNKIDRIHFLKIDAEGYEYKILQGAKDLLKKSAVDYIQFEFGGTDIDTKVFMQDFYYLLNSKYQIYRILRNGLFPITNYSESMEIFLGSNYLAEKRSLAT